MQEREELDALDKAVMSIDINYPAQQWDSDRLGTKKDEHRHACCSECGRMGLVALDDGSKNKYECKGCGAKLRRASYRGPSGPNQSESRARRQRDIGDGYLPNSGVNRASKESRAFIQYAHTKLEAGDFKQYAKQLRNVTWDAYRRASEQFQLDKNDNVMMIPAQLFCLVEYFIEVSRAGQPRPTKAEMARRALVDESQFSMGRRWARVAIQINEVIQKWEDEMRREIGEGR